MPRLIAAHESLIPHECRTLCALAYLSLVICSGNLSAQDGQPVSLRYQFRQGEIVRYSVSMLDEYTLQIGTAQDQPWSRQDSIKSYRVGTVHDDGSAVLELTLVEQIAIEVEENGLRSTYDSRKPADQIPPAFLPLANMVGRPTLQLTISPTGEVANVKSLLPESQQPEEIARNATEVLPRLPEESVSIGGSWTEKLNTSINLPNATLKKVVKMERRYRLTSVENGLATVEMETKILSPVRAEDELDLIRRTPNVTFILDLERGLLVSRTLRLDNQVVGFGGNAASLMKVRQRHVDKLLPSQAAGGSQSPR